MRVPLALALLLLAGSFAGCTSIGSSNGPAVGSARDWQGTADRAAHKWAADAVLMSASATEFDDAARAGFADGMQEVRDQIDEARKGGDLPEEAEAEIDAFLDVTDIIADTPDPKAGDGKATAWAYVYTADSKPDEVDAIMVARGDVVYHSHNDDGILEEFHDLRFDGTLGNWSVDSDEAANAANLGNDDFAAVRGMTNVMVNFQLLQDYREDGGEKTLWSVWAEADDDDGEEVDEAQVDIDANTGALIVDQAIEQFVEVLQQEAGEEGGAFFFGVDTTQGTSFNVVQPGHAQLAFEAQIVPAPVQPVTVTLTDPNGTATQLVLQQGQSPNRAEAHVLVANVPLGAYSVEIQAPVSTFDQWRFSWCTDGTPLSEDEGGDALACTLLDQSGGDESTRPARGMPSPLSETLSRLHGWTATWEP